MAVTSIRFYGPSKPKPKLGDRKLIRGVLHERRLKKVHDHLGRPIGYDCTGGRQRYAWVLAAPEVVPATV